MQAKFYFSLLFALIGCSVADKFKYDGYRLVKLVPQTLQHVELLNEWEGQPDFDIWTRVKDLNSTVDVLLSPSAFLQYAVLFERNGIEYNIVDNDIQKKIEEQEQSMIRTKADPSIVGKFARYQQIQDFIDNTVLNNPKIASSYVAGKTYENRNLKVIVLKTDSSKRSVWIDCGIHAREWISPATCVYMINKLVTEYNSNVQTTVNLLNYFEFHILPILNPDGYEYSFTTYRMWRKNRRPNSGTSCVGTDLNRNSGFKWLTGGSSTNPCSDVYAGPSANSELEIKGLQNAINAKLGQWDAYLTLHTYGQWWFTTWGYADILPPNYAEYVSKARIGVAALQAVYGTPGWVVGSSAKILGPASGGSEDWAQAVAGVKYAYCIELRPGQTGTDAQYGFALPEDRAPKAGEETYQGIKAFLNSIIRN